MYLKHRNSQKRIYIRDTAYFVTAKTHDNFPYFRERIFCDLFIETLRLHKQLKGFLIYGWVLIYDHFHLLIEPKGRWNISDVMFSIKKQFSHNVNRVMGFNPIFVESEGAQALARLRIRYVIQHDIHWKYFFEFDQYVHQSKNQFQTKYPNGHPFPEFQWQKSFIDHYTRNSKDFENHLEYIAGNPDKHNMPKNWPYVFTNPKFENLNDEF